MIGLTFTLALQLTLASTDSHAYATAYEEMEQSGRPLLVLVGADWCPGCRTMKQTVLPNLQKAGQLKDISMALVNTDQSSALANKLMRGGTIPQLVLFTKTEAGWQRTQLTGAQSESQVRTFIERALENHVGQKAVAETASRK
jgi:thioredoxin-like negative regulator of GroEL